MHIVIPVLTRIFSALCGLAILGAGALVAIETVANWSGNGFVVLPPDWPDQLRSTSWDDAIVRNLLLAALAVGIALLLVAFWRRPPLTVDSGQEGIEVERHALETSLRRRLDSLDGVASSQVRVDNTTITATVDTTRRLAPDAVRGRAVTELAEFCSFHGLPLTTDVRVHVEGVSR